VASLVPPPWVRPAARHAVHRALYLGAGLAGLVRRLQVTRSTSVPDSVRSVLIIRIDLLGDVLFTIPLLQSVRQAYPSARITLVTLPYTAQFAESYGLADRVLAFDTNHIRTPSGLLSPKTWTSYWRIVREIRREQPDLAISVAGRTASLVAFLSGADRTIGYEDEAYPYMLTDGLPGGRYRERKHEVEYVRSLARYAGGHDVPRTLRAVPCEDDTRAVGKKLEARGITPADQLVVIHAGSINGSAKRWPAKRWGAFADAVRMETGAKVVLAGAASDITIGLEVAAASQTPVPSLIGSTTIGELVALLARADLVASGDSGPLHLAVALERPLVAAYGPTDPKVHGPYHPSGPVRIHRADLPCSPCYSMAAVADCPLGDPVCMRLVSVRSMVASAVYLLAGGSGSTLVDERQVPSR
jgi:lipopolysaccharide heptosyltransferase II